MKLTLPAVLAAAFIVPSSFAEKIEPRNVPAMLEELSAIEKLVGEAFTARTSLAMGAFKAAAVSEKAALDFYLKCFRELNFTRDDAKASEWRTWLERNERRHEEEGFALGLQLQLKYLILTIQVKQADDLGMVLPEISRYLETVGASLENLGPRIDMLRRPVTGTVFAEAYMLDQALDLGDWDATPLNLGGLFGKTIIPYLKEKQPAQVGAAWDARIMFEQKLVANRESPALERIYTEERLPSLRWERSRDLFEAGMEAIAVRDMLTIAKQHSTHPSAPEWIRELKEILVRTTYPESSPFGEGEAPADTPAAPATPAPAAPAPVAPAPGPASPF